MLMKKILLICNDVIGFKMAGPAIRCLEIGKSLSTKFDVTVAAKNLDADYLPGVKVCPATNAAINAAAKVADLIIIQGDALVRYPQLKDTVAVLVADMYCPIPLEYHQSSQRTPAESRFELSCHVTKVMFDQLIYADHFLCASIRQRDFWAGALTMAGRINGFAMPNALHTGLEHFFSVLPFGLPDVEASTTKHQLRDKFRLKSTDFVMVWGGGLYEWFDVLTVIRAVAQLSNSGHAVHLVFLGVKHPNPDILAHDCVGEAVQLSKDLGLYEKHVHFNFGWVDYAVRHEYLLDADLGVSCHFDNFETRYSFRTRMLDYLWCGLPILATKGDIFEELIVANKIGAAIGYQDVEGWCNEIEAMIDDSNLVDERRRNSRSLGRDFKWSKTTSIFLDRCADLTVQEDRARIRRLNKPASNGMVRLARQVVSVYQRRGLLGVIKKAMQGVIK